MRNTIILVFIFAAYAFVSEMDYQDALLEAQAAKCEIHGQCERGAK